MAQANEQQTEALTDALLDLVVGAGDTGPGSPGDDNGAHRA